MRPMRHRVDCPKQRLLAAGGGGNVAIWDLSAIDRYIAGNLDYQIARLADELGDAIGADAFRAWRDEVLARGRTGP